MCQWSLDNIVYSQVEIPFYTQACLCVNQSLYGEVWGFRYTSIIEIICACLCVNQSLYGEVWGFRYTSIIEIICACLCVNQSLYGEVWGFRYTSIIEIICACLCVNQSLYGEVWGFRYTSIIEIICIYIYMYPHVLNAYTHAHNLPCKKQSLPDWVYAQSFHTSQVFGC